MELVREAPPLVLLGGDELLGEPLPLRLPGLGLGEELRVVGRARREVGEDGGANEVTAVEGAVALEPERRDLAAPRAQRKRRRAAGRGWRFLSGPEELPARAEKLFRPAPRLLA